MRLVLLSMAASAFGLGLLAPTVASAGGIGVMGTGGLYSDRVWYYDSSGNQYEQKQIIPTYGTGLDLVLGDRDDKITGIARFYWLGEGPQANPADTSNIEIAPSDVTANVREETNHIGVFAVGLQGGLIGDPDKGMFVVNGVLGSGFLTSDHREFVYGEVGVGGTYRIGQQIELFGNINGQLRFQKWARPGGAAYLGARVLFD